MAKEKESNLLGLSSLTDSGTLATYGSLGGTSLSKAEARIVAEGRKQLLAMRCQEAKTVAGLGHIAQMHRSGSNHFYHTMVHLEAVNQLAQDSAMQPYIIEFNRHAAQQSARHLRGAIEVGARSIAEVIAESCIPPDEPEPGFWARLWGGA